MKAVRIAATATATFALALVSNVHDSAACGGCFHPPPGVSSGTESEISVVTDHRMAFKISTDETILWDQVRYSGDPKEFAWVLPVRAGAKIELSRDEWMYALDTATKTTVTGPTVTCSGTNVTSVGRGSGGSGGGCGGGTDYQTFGDSTPTSGSSNGSSFAGNEDVQVVSDTVIGPYQAVTIHSSDGKGVGAWLEENGFAIPDNIVPVIDAYTKEQFDFIALRLRPGQGVRAMRPVRIVTPGADVSLPLRMVAAGVGAHVGITLFVVSEGRYHTQNFPDSPIDWSQLAWDGRAKRSNMTELVAGALASNGQRGWITEAAIRDSLGGFGLTNQNRSAAQVYETACITNPPHVVPCDETALPPANGSPDGTGSDAGADASDAGADSGDAGPGTAPPPACTKVVSGCDGFDDYDVATRGLHFGDIWITRLRADLPAAALDADLRLEAAAQVEDRPERSTVVFTDKTFNPCNPATPAANNGQNASPPSDQTGGCTCRSTRFQSDAGSWVVIGFAALGASIVSRRRRR